MICVTNRKLCRGDFLERIEQLAAGGMRSYYGKKICPFQNMQHLPNSVWRFVRHIIRRCG